MVISSGLGQHFIATKGEANYIALKKYLEDTTKTKISVPEMSIALLGVSWFLETFPLVSGEDILEYCPK